MRGLETISTYCTLVTNPDTLPIPSTGKALDYDKTFDIKRFQVPPLGWSFRFCHSSIYLSLFLTFSHL